MIFNPALLNVLSVLFLMFLGCFVYFSKKNRSNFAFLLLTFSAAVWQAGTYLTIIAENPEVAFFWTKVSYIGVTLIPVTMFQLVIELLGLKQLRKMVFLSYAVALFIYIPITWANIFLNGVYQFQWGYWFKATQYHPLYILSYSFLFFVNLLLLYFASKKQSGSERTRTIYLLIALLVSYGGAIDYLTDYGINIYPSGFLFVVACLTIISYAITKTHLMDISVIISKSIAYGITMIVLGTSYLLLVSLYRVNISPNIDIGFISLTVSYGIFVGFAFERLRMFIQTSSDKVFLKGRYDFKNTMSYFVEILFRAVSMEDLQSLLEKARLEIIESKVLRIVSVNDPQDSKVLPKEIIDLLSNARKIESLSDIKHKLKDDADIEQLKDVEFFVPCFSGDSFIAVLLVGKKLSDDPYKADEIDVFRVLAPQFAKVIERIQPYEKAKIDLVAEQEKVKIAQQAAEENARLATLGTLAAGLAHEIRNPMTVLRSRAERGASHLGDAEFNKESNDLTIKHIDRILNIVNRMLKFARSKEGAFKETNINDILDEMVSMAENKIKDKSIKIEKDFGQVPSIDCDPDPLLEALLNICINSVESIEKEGRITIKSSLSQMCNVSGNKFPAVLIEIEDSGKGISEENIPRIFDPFFTTRHEGTGLGLSIAHRIIAEEHQGIIDVKSSQGKGTKFSIYLPADR